MTFYFSKLRWLTNSVKLQKLNIFVNKSPLRYFSDIDYHSVTRNRNRLRFMKTSKETKILKVAIIGVPNAGKSTLINQIVGRNVFAVSRKVHTTRCRAKAVMVVDDTQVVFLDTPGLVSIKESVKHHLETSCVIDSEEAVKEADVIGVIHDVANKYTRERLDPKVLRILYLYPEKLSFLILNKVDAMSHKSDLLKLVNILNNSDDKERGLINHKKMSHDYLQSLIEKESGWSHFKDIFMVSAINGDGVGDIKIYLLKMAQPGKWLYDESVITDQNEVQVVENAVFSKLLEFLPNVVPYNLKVSLEYLNRAQDGSLTAVVLIGCRNLRTQKFVMGKGGGRMKQIALGVEQDLRKFVLNDVRIKLVLVNEKELEKNDSKYEECLQDTENK